MDIESLIDKVLKFSSIKNGSFNYSIPIKSDLIKFIEENSESSPLLFEYILYKIIKCKLKNGIAINFNLIIISEDFLNINFKNKHYVNLAADLFLVPFKDNSINKWGLLLLPNQDNKDIIVKMIVYNKSQSNKSELIFKNIASRLNNYSKKIDKCKFDIIDINGVSNTSKFILNFINELLDKDRDKTNLFLKKIFNRDDNNNNEDKGQKVYKSEDIIGKLSYNNELFNNLMNNYNNEYNDYLKNKNNKLLKMEIKNKEKKNDNTSVKFEDIQNSFENNLNIEKEKQKNLIFNEKEKIKIKLKNEKRSDDNLEELAQKVVKSIMNLGVDKRRNSEKKKKAIQNNNSNNEKKLSKITQNIIEESFNKIKLENENIKKTKTFKELEINEGKDKDIFNIENDEKKECLNNTMDDIFDININQVSYENMCDNKKIDEVTKNTIDNILNSVLNDMKINSIKYSRKYMKKKNKINSKYRLRTINIDQRIETIEEEDKESSTSEVNRNDKLHLNAEEEKKMNCKEKDELKDSIKTNNSFEFEPRPSAYSFNRENSDENCKLKEGEIEFEEKEVKIRKDTVENEKGKILLQNLNIDDIKESISKKNSEDIEHKEDNENKENSHKSDSNSNDINDNNSINNTISNNNSVIDNNYDLDNNINNYYEIDSLDNIKFNINRSNTTKEKEKEKNNIKNIIRKSSPKDNNRKKRINSKKNSFNIQPEIILKNIINNNTTNNININTINTQNIIIINNTISSDQNYSKIKKDIDINNSNLEKDKKEEIKTKKEPEDEKVPKDNRSKRKNKNYQKIEVNNKEPSDGKKHNLNNSKLSSNINKERVIKDELDDNESKYSSKTIEVDKYNNNINEKGIDILRSNSGLDNYRKNLDESINNIKKIIKPHISCNNVNNLRQKYLQLGKQKHFEHKKSAHIKNEIIQENIINDCSSSRELNARKKLNINKNIINNLENKYPNILNKKKKINTNIDLKANNLNSAEFDKIPQKTKELKQKKTQNTNMQEKEMNESSDIIEENCIVY